MKFYDHETYKKITRNKKMIFLDKQTTKQKKKEIKFNKKNIDFNEVQKNAKTSS